MSRSTELCDICPSTKRVAQEIQPDKIPQCSQLPTACCRGDHSVDFDLTSDTINGAGQGEVADENESVLIAKTIEANFEKVKNEVEKIHPYICPCVVKITVSSNDKYFEWLSNEVK